MRFCWLWWQRRRPILCATAFVAQLRWRVGRLRRQLGLGSKFVMALRTCYDLAFVTVPALPSKEVFVDLMLSEDRLRPTPLDFLLPLEPSNGGFDFVGREGS